MLTLVRTPLPTADAGTVPPAAADLLARRRQAPQRFGWVVPTARRRRAIVRGGLPDGRTAALLPQVHTPESFVAQALAYSPRQRPAIDTPERLLRIARAWHEASGRPAGPGLVTQLDRFVRDWRAGGQAAAADVYGRCVGHYVRGLDEDGRLDRVGSLLALTAELRDPQSPAVPLMLARVETILFDGFHRLAIAELDLVVALARHRDVLLWLVGVPGQRSWRTVEANTEVLRRLGADPAVIDHVPPADGIPALGRRLFPGDDVRPAAAGPVPGVFRLEAPSPVAEVEAVAARIKADVTATPLRLSDVTIVVPDAAYEPLVRDALTRAGLPFNLAGRDLRVATSRPARVLTAALDLVHGQWRADLLRDFLAQPLVQRRLQQPHRLHDLFDYRPRARRRLDHDGWLAAWQAQLDRLRGRVAGWRDGTLPLPERVLLPRDEYAARQAELADGLEQLLASIRTVLAPVAALEAVLATAPADAVRQGVAGCRSLLRVLEVDRWLSPYTAGAGTAVPWVEYEKDQQAYYRLLAILEALAALPEARRPRDADGRPDAAAALRLALAGESYQVMTEDDAGVQVLGPREVRGLRFRHVYALGLVDGRAPALPEEGALTARMRHDSALAEHLRQKEDEAAYLFAQLFEAAGERLALCRPRRDDDRPAAASPLWGAVAACATLPPLPPADLVVTARDAAARLGRAAAARAGAPLAELWPNLPTPVPALAALHEVLTAARARAGLPHDVRVDAAALLRAVFPDGRAFSPSELEVYAGCPFRYFVGRVLGLDERETDRRRMHYGTLVHRVLQRHYEGRRAALGTTGPLPPTDAADRARLVALFREEAGQLEDGMLPPELAALFEAEAGVADLLMLVLTEIEARAGHGNLLTEHAVGPVLLGHDADGRPVLLAGKTDRVDVRVAAPADAVVFDYKTGRVLTAAERRHRTGDGRLLQLPLYGALLMQARPDLRVVGGAYVHLADRCRPEERSARHAIAAVGSVFADDGRPDPFDPKAARQQALGLAAAIRRGRFPLTVHGSAAAHPECTSYCPARNACRHPAGYKAPHDA